MAVEVETAEVAEEEDTEILIGDTIVNAAGTMTGMTVDLDLTVATGTIRIIAGITTGMIAVETMTGMTVDLTAAGITTGMIGVTAGVTDTKFQDRIPLRMK